MSDETTTAKPTSKRAEKSPLEIATEQGFLGVEVDPTPNENYTVAGVTAGLPTPETDADHADEVRRYQRDNNL